LRKRLNFTALTARFGMHSNYYKLWRRCTMEYVQAFLDKANGTERGCLLPQSSGPQ
jgi:hypothetical protein